MSTNRRNTYLVMLSIIRCSQPVVDVTLTNGAIQFRTICTRQPEVHMVEVLLHHINLMVDTANLIMRISRATLHIPVKITANSLDSMYLLTIRLAATLGQVVQLTDTTLHHTVDSVVLHLVPDLVVHLLHIPDGQPDRRQVAKAGMLSLITLMVPAVAIQVHSTSSPISPTSSKEGTLVALGQLVNRLLLAGGRTIGLDTLLRIDLKRPGSI